MNKHIYQTVILAGLIGVSCQALAANKVDYVDIRKGGINMNEGKVFVKPINGVYSQVTNATVPYPVEMRAACKGNNVLKSARVYFGKQAVSKTILENSNAYSKNILTGNRQALSWTGVNMQVPVNKLGFNPVQVCKDYMNKKLSQGVSKHQILNSEHVINHKTVTLQSIASCSRPSKTNHHYGWDNYSATVKVVCKKGAMSGIGGIQTKTPKPGQPGMGFAAKAKITKVAFKAQKAHTTGTCPLQVKFDGDISMDGPGTVKYRIAFPGAIKTGWKTLKFQSAGNRKIQQPVFTATKTYKTATAILEVDEPNKKKVYASFKVSCIAAGGPANIKMNAPSQSDKEGTYVLQPPKVSR